MLFDDIERAETRARLEREPIFAYLNSSARAPVAAARQVLEKWFERYPESGKDDSRARFRSPIDAQHKSAFWELYLHELFSGLGYSLEPHPDIEGSSNHPDFLVKHGAVPQFYLEAVVAGLPSAKDAGAEARLAEVLDLVNKLQASDWFLHVEYRGLPKTPPPVKPLRDQLEDWLAGLDRAEIQEMLNTEGWDGLPRFEWTHDGLTLSFAASPRSEKAKTRSDVRPIGIVMGEGYLIQTDKDIRRALQAKAKKYGELKLALVVAVNVVSEHCDDIDMYNALFGTEAVVVTRAAEAQFKEAGRRLPDGVWFGNNGPRNKGISAVLIGYKIDVYSSGSKTPVLVHHPYPARRLALPTYPLPESAPNEQTHRMDRRKGRPAKEFLRLPELWPPESD